MTKDRFYQVNTDIYGGKILDYLNSNGGREINQDESVIFYMSKGGTIMPLHFEEDYNLVSLSPHNCPSEIYGI